MRDFGAGDSIGEYCSLPCFRFGTSPERFFGLVGYDALLSIVYDPWELGDVGWP